MLKWMEYLDPVVQAAIIGACATVLGVIIKGIFDVVTNKKNKDNTTIPNINTKQNNSGNNNANFGEQNQDSNGNVQNTYINCNVQQSPQTQENDGFEDRMDKYMREHTATNEDINRLFADSEVKCEYSNKNKTGSFTFDYSNNNGEYTIGSDEFTFVTKWSKANDVSIHAYRDCLGANGAIARIKSPSIWPIKLDGTYDFSSRARTFNIGDVIIWRNSSNKYAATKIISIKDDTRGAESDELTCEYVIYNTIVNENKGDKRIIELGNAKMVKMKNLAGGDTVIIGEEKTITEQILKEHDMEIEKTISEI